VVLDQQNGVTYLDQAVQRFEQAFDIGKPAPAARSRFPQEA
jgi:hypothetical protein